MACKSHLACAVASACLRAGHAVYVSTVPDLLETLRRGYSQQANDSFERRYDAITCADLLVLDDLGTQSDTIWAAEKLYQIVDFRYRQRLPLMVTTNVNPFAPGERIEPRVHSRLMDGAHVTGSFLQEHLLTAGDYQQRTARRAQG